MQFISALVLISCIQIFVAKAGQLRNGGSFELHKTMEFGRGTFPLAKKRAIYNVTFSGADSAETTADILTRLKLLAYAEKLNAKETKKKAKAAKEQAWNQSLLSLYSTNSSALGSPSPIYPPPLSPLFPFAIPPASVAIPPIPMIPAFGLWKKSFYLSQLYGAMANANAAAAAQYAATASPPLPAQTSATTRSTSNLINNQEDKIIKDIAKRYAPYMREKYDKPWPYKKEKKHSNKNNKNSNDDEEESENSSRSKDDTFDPIESSLSGASNRFGSSPGRGSPVSQAGCSGSHIHICSGTTLYLNGNNEKSLDDQPPSTHRKQSKKSRKFTVVKPRKNFQEENQDDEESSDENYDNENDNDEEEYYPFDSYEEKNDAEAEQHNKNDTSVEKSSHADDSPKSQSRSRKHNKHNRHDKRSTDTLTPNDAPKELNQHRQQETLTRHGNQDNNLAKQGATKIEDNLYFPIM